MLKQSVRQEAKALAEAQYERGQYNDFGDCIGFSHKGQWIVNPWLDPSGRFDLDDEEAARIYGVKKFDNFCLAIIRDNNAKKVTGYDSSLVRHTGII